MPVDRSHAFAGGPVYARPGALGAVLNRRVAAAWRAFDTGATLRAGCRLGPNAWCHNDGPRGAVELGGCPEPPRDGFQAGGFVNDVVQFGLMR